MPAPLDRILHPVDISPFCNPSPPQQQDRKQDRSIDQLTSSIAPYKRVPKACTQCRRDKTRCDQARPCNGCVRKGRGQFCLDGCVACRRARLRCDGNRPCATCAEHGRECIEDDPAAIASARSRHSENQRQKILVVSTTPTAHLPTTGSTHTSAPPSPSSAPPRKSRTRSKPSRSADNRIKLTCLICRRDHKKCPGGRPCATCVQRGERCVYVARAPKLVKQRCALCRKKNKKCEEARPCIHCVKAAADCIDLPRKGTGPGVRVKRACVGCRADKIQCEEERPCGACKKKKILCVERECTACFERGEKCASCVRRSNCPLDESPSDESDTDSEGISTPSVVSSTSSNFPLDPRLVDQPSPPPPPPMQHYHPYPPPKPMLYAPPPGPSFSASGVSGPLMHPMRPYHLPPTPESPFFFYSDSPQCLSLSASLSDVRTRPDHTNE